MAAILWLSLSFSAITIAISIILWIKILLCSSDLNEFVKFGCNNIGILVVMTICLHIQQSAQILDSPFMNYASSVLITAIESMFYLYILIFLRSERIAMNASRLKSIECVAITCVIIVISIELIIFSFKAILYPLFNAGLSIVLAIICYYHAYYLCTKFSKTKQRMQKSTRCAALFIISLVFISIIQVIICIANFIDPNSKTVNLLISIYMLSIMITIYLHFHALHPESQLYRVKKWYSWICIVTEEKIRHIVDDNFTKPRQSHPHFVVEEENTKNSPKEITKHDQQIDAVKNIKLKETNQTSKEEKIHLMHSSDIGTIIKQTFVIQQEEIKHVADVSMKSESLTCSSSSTSSIQAQPPQRNQMVIDEQYLEPPQSLLLSHPSLPTTSSPGVHDKHDRIIRHETESTMKSHIQNVVFSNVTASNKASRQSTHITISTDDATFGTRSPQNNVTSKSNGNSKPILMS